MQCTNDHITIFNPAIVRQKQKKLKQRLSYQYHETIDIIWRNFCNALIWTAWGFHFREKLKFVTRVSKWGDKRGLWDKEALTPSYRHLLAKLLPMGTRAHQVGTKKDNFERVGNFIDIPVEPDAPQQAVSDFSTPSLSIKIFLALTSRELLRNITIIA